MRDENAWCGGHIPGTRHLAEGVLELEIEKAIPDTSGEVVVYGEGGLQSVLAAATLLRMGYGKVSPLAGGWRQWISGGAANREVVEASGAARERTPRTGRPGAVVAMLRGMNVVSSEAQVREWVHRYQVTWETRSALAPGDGSSVVAIGYIVELSAVPDRSAGAGDCFADTDRRACQDVEDALERIARDVSLTEEAHEAHDIHVARGCLQMGTAHGHRAEIWAVIILLNREHLDQPAVAADQKHGAERLGHVVSRLRALGAQEGHWREVT